MGRPRPRWVDSAHSGTSTLEIPSDLTVVESVVNQAVRRCESARVDRRRLRLNFRVGLMEAISNAMLYGCAGDPGCLVRVELRIRTREIRARVTDGGEGFDPNSVPDPRLPENILKSTGRGICLMRALMDEVRFNAAGNSVTLILRALRDAQAAPEN